MSLTKFALYPVYQNDIVMQAIVYLLLPLVFFVGLSAIGAVLNKYSHFVFSLLTGGRA